MNIKLSAQYFDAVVSGHKTTTIRSGIRPYTLGPAVMQLVDDNGITVDSHRITITGLKISRFDRLTHADALSDGFGTVDLLIKALLTHYEEAELKYLTIVEFTLATLDP